MAKSFISVAMCFLAFQLSAQVEFAPLGSTWVYNVETYNDGPDFDPLEDYFEINSEEDVEIGGKTYRKVGEYFFNQDGYEVYYLLEGEDRLVYKFDLEVGDSATFKLLDCNKEKADVVLTLQEIEIVNINGEDLRRFIFEYNHLLQNDYVYTEKFGSVSTIVDETVNCGTIVGAEFSWLRCFIEGDKEYKSQRFLSLGGDDCYYSKPMSVNQYKDIEINFYPNPMTDFLFISGSTNMPTEFNVDILSLEGKAVLSQRNFKSGDKLDLSALSSGMYFIQLIDLNGISITNEKITILK